MRRTQHMRDFVLMNGSLREAFDNDGGLIELDPKPKMNQRMEETFP